MLHDCLKGLYIEKSNQGNPTVKQLILVATSLQEKPEKRFVPRALSTGTISEGSVSNTMMGACEQPQESETQSG